MAVAALYLASQYLTQTSKDKIFTTHVDMRIEWLPGAGASPVISNLSFISASLISHLAWPWPTVSALLLQYPALQLHIGLLQQAFPVSARGGATDSLTHQQQKFIQVAHA